MYVCLSETLINTTEKRKRLQEDQILYSKLVLKREATWNFLWKSNESSEYIAIYEWNFMIVHFNMFRQQET